MDCALTEQGNSGLTSEFWQQWTQYQDQLYRCCLKLMNSNPTDAEDALSQAMLKAWEKVQKYAGKIDNLKAWLFKLTSNLCIDIIRKRSQGAVGIESIEWVGDTEEIGIGSTVASPESCLETEEKSTEIRQAIASLPEKLRDTFILHFYQERTHTEIAEQQGISYDSVCKRLSRVRKLLKPKLSAYFQGSEEQINVTTSIPKKSLTLGENGEKQNTRVPEEKKVLEIATVSAEIECVEVVEAETPESVEPRDLVGKPITNDAEVSGENQRYGFATLSPFLAFRGATWNAKRVQSTQPCRKLLSRCEASFAPVVLLNLMQELTGTGGVLALLFCRENAVLWLSRIASRLEGLHQTFRLHKAWNLDITSFEGRVVKISSTQCDTG